MLAVGGSHRRDGLAPWLAVAAAVHALAFFARLAPAAALASNAAGIADVIEIVQTPPEAATPALSQVDPPEATEAPAPPPINAPKVEPALAKPDVSPAKLALEERSAQVAEAAVAALGAAAKTLFRDDDAPDAFAIARGNADGAFGYVSSSGTGRGTFDRRATDQGFQGGRGASETPHAAVDKTRAAHVIGGYANDCPYPDKADGIDHMTVEVVVHVGADGKAKNVIVVRDPGHGFGEAARRCAMKHPFAPARDHDGKPIEAITAPVTVRFTR